MVAAQHLKRQGGIDHLVVGITVEQLRGLVVHDLAQQRGDRLALVEPLPAQLGQRLGRVTLVERDEARDPAISKILMVERSEEHTSELQSLMRISYAVFCLKKKKQERKITSTETEYKKAHNMYPQTIHYS